MQRVAGIGEDHAVALLGRERLYALLALELAARAARHGDHRAVLAHLHAVIAAGDAIAHRHAHRQRRAAMRAMILQHDRLPRLVAPQRDLEAEPAQRDRPLAEEMRRADRIPDVAHALGEQRVDRLVGHGRHGLLPPRQKTVIPSEAAQRAA
jgi:hypothetical protein